MLRHKALWLTAGIFTVSIAATTLPMAVPFSVALSSKAAGDSIAVKAIWVGRCTGTDCPDGYRITWFVNGATQPTKQLSTMRDSIRVARPICPAVAIVQVSVVATRRGLVSSGTAQTRTIQCVDVAPQPVDSLTLDTLRAQADRDSYPLWEPRVSHVLRRASDTAQLCVFARNRYTNAVTVRRVASVDDATLIAQCVDMASRFALEKSS